MNRYQSGLLAVLAVAAGMAAFWGGALDDILRQKEVEASGKNASALTASAEAAAAKGAGGASQTAPYSAAGLQSRQEQLAMWRARYERAEQVYANYRDATRYPHDSRGLTAQSDQNRPFDPISEEKTLRNAKGEPIRGMRLRTSQERVFVTGSETVKFSVEAVDDKGNNLALQVARASAQSVPEGKTPQALIQANIEFADNGSGADAQANDGKLSAILNPALQGFAGYSGTIRLLATVSVGSEQGMAHFDVIYTPQSPASWVGVREVMEGGSLSFYLKANVARAGRYVVSGRVDDAAGNPFALLQFNEEVGSGLQEFKLRLFGALVRDKNPAFPLRLRDVDGFLLLADLFPDRAMMPRQIGIVHTSARYSVEQFSPNEWNSEERDRYLAEYGKDAETALAQINRLGGK